ncbi:uncharacterized protein LOC143298015 [Babylonia areolata]|uniref:uncharacterized protein LOC143298015 n=1 Tax=Babylonia areolata TaxID=304850 RepID=UPI003FCF2E57
MAKKKKTWNSVCLWMLLLQGLCWQWGCCSECLHDETVFQKTAVDELRAVVLECRAPRDFYSVRITEAKTSGNPEQLVILSWENECFTKESFAACSFGSEYASAKVLVTDLQEEERRNYICVIALIMQNDLEKRCYALNITKQVPSTTPTDLTTSSTTESETSEKPNVATSDERYGVSNTLPIVVVLISMDIVLMVITSVLGCAIYKLKHSQRKPPAHPDITSAGIGATDNVGSHTAPQDAPGGVGAGGGRRGSEGGVTVGMELGVAGRTAEGMGRGITLPYQPSTTTIAPTTAAAAAALLPSPAPSLAAPGMPQRVVESDYQRPSNVPAVVCLTRVGTDAGQMPEATARYQVPRSNMKLSTDPPHATSTPTRSQPNPHLVMVPDFSTTTPPGEDTDAIVPPIQETGPASIEDSAFSE